MVRNLFFLKRLFYLFRWVFRHKTFCLCGLLLILVFVGRVSAYDAVDFESGSVISYSESGSGLHTYAEGFLGADYSTFCDYYGYDHVPWCALFVSYCAEQAGYQIDPNANCDNLFYNNGGINGVDGLSIDDVLFFDWDGDGYIDHVGIVSEVTSTTVTTVEGNADDTVKKLNYSLTDSNLFGYVRLSGGNYGISLASYDTSASTSAGTSNVTIMEGVIDKISPLDDYVYARTGDSTYVLAWGDLVLTDSIFTGAADYVVYERLSNSSSVYTYSHFYDDDFSLDAGDYLVYSSLGLYPALGGSDRVIFPLCMLCFIGIALAIFIVPIRWSR